MSLPANTQAILLLTAYFNKASDNGIRPLTNKEWGKFALWLKDKDLLPESLLRGKLEELLAGWHDSKVTLQRLEQLLQRGSAMALAVEKWSRAGLWVITRSDADYPLRLKKHLKNDSPAVLFGCGNRGLLNRGGLAVIGSRNSGEEDLGYSRAFGEKAAENALSIISGGARGVDECAMLGALEAEGTVIGILADSLLRASHSKKYRQHIMNNNLLLVSPFYPEAGFNTGNAMQRNKFIYCLADAAVVVHSGSKGGTWNGALENLKKHWAPLWVKETHDTDAGNARLVASGGQWLTANIHTVDMPALLTKTVKSAESLSMDLFSQPEQVAVNDTARGLKLSEPATAYSSEHHAAATEHCDRKANTKPLADQVATLKKEADEQAVLLTTNYDISFYQLFLTKVHRLCSDEPKTTAELVDAINLNKSQINTWLKHAVDEKKLKKLNRPVRYQWAGEQQEPLL